MKSKPSLLCQFQKVPKPLRLLLGWLLIFSGFPLFLTPFPGGSVLIAVGCLLLYCASPALRVGVGRYIFRFPWLARKMAPFLAACETCGANAAASGHRLQNLLQNGRGGVRNNASAKPNHS